MGDVLYSDPKFKCVAEAQVVKARSCSRRTEIITKRRADEQTGNEGDGLRWCADVNWRCKRKGDSSTWYQLASGTS